MEILEASVCRVRISVKLFRLVCFKVLVITGRYDTQSDTIVSDLLLVMVAMSLLAVFFSLKEDNSLSGMSTIGLDTDLDGVFD